MLAVGRAERWKQRFQDQPALYFLLLLLAGDLAYIALHLLFRLTDLLDDPLLALTRDRGYAEFYQYVKMSWIILLLIMVAVTSRTAGYAAWVMVFAYLLFDDALRLHERGGSWLAMRLALVPVAGLGPKDIGQLAVSLSAGTLLLAMLAGFYARGADAFRRASRHLLALLLVLVFFGVFIDMLHIAGRTMHVVFEVLEEGGEMVAMSLLACYAFHLAIHEGRI